MRNHSKSSKEKNKPAIRSKATKKLTTYGNHSIVLKKIKEIATASGTPMECVDSKSNATSPECIFLDAGSKKSYIDLTEAKATNEPFPRISVIRTVGSQSPSASQNDHFEFYQEKPVDFSPKHKYKSEFTGNGNRTISISTQYPTMVV